MSMYEPLRDAFREMNRMFVDKQQWDAEHARRAENDAWNRRVQEQQMEMNEMKRQSAAIALEKQKVDITPVDFSVYNMGDPDHIRKIMSDPKAAELMTRAVDDDGVGLTFNPADGTFRDAGNNVRQFSPMQIRQRAMGLYGIIDMHNKAPENVQMNLIDMQQTRKGLVAEGKKYTDPRFASQAAEVNTKLAALDKEIERANAFLDPKSGQMFQYYVKKSKQMRARAVWAQSMGASELAAEFGRASNKLAASADLAFKALIEKGTKTGTKQVTWYANEDGVINPKTGKPMKQNQSFVEYIPVGAEGAVSRDGFSIAKVPGPQGGSGGRTAYTSAYKVGLGIIEKKALPRNMIIPNEKFETDFWLSASKRYAKNVKDKHDMNEADATIHAETAIQETMAKHNEGKAVLDKLNAIKKQKPVKGKYIVEMDDGSSVEWTRKQLDEAIAKTRQSYNKELGYIPVWGFEEYERE